MSVFTTDKDVLHAFSDLKEDRIIGFLVYVNFANNQCMLVRNSEISTDSNNPYENLFNLLKAGEARIMVVRVNATFELGSQFSQPLVALWLDASVPDYDVAKLKQATQALVQQLNVFGSTTLANTDPIQLAEWATKVGKSRVIRLHKTPLAWSVKAGYCRR